MIKQLTALATILFFIMATVPAVAKEKLLRTDVDIWEPQIFLLGQDDDHVFRPMFMSDIEQKSISTTSSGTPPIYTFLERNAVAPFAGTLLSPGAAAKILGEVKKTDLICRFKIDHETEKVYNECKAELDLIETMLFNEQAKHTASLNQKNKELENLSELMGDDKYKWLWAIAGATAGVLLTLGAVHVAN